MDRRTAAAVGLLGWFAGARLPEPSPTLLTLPQHDRFRSRLTPPGVSLSADGRYIAFASYARLTPDDADSQADVYLLDRTRGEITLQSHALAGYRMDGDAFRPRISRDARFIVYEAMIEHQTQRVVADVVLRDRVTGVATCVSRPASGEPPDGWSGSGEISDDGSAVVFVSTATNLVPGGDANGTHQDVYLFDTRAGVLRRISVDRNGAQRATGQSAGPAMSGDGRHVAFMSTAPLATPLAAAGGQRPGVREQAHVYLRDTELNDTILLTARGVVPNGASGAASVSRDGRFVAFVSTAANLVPSDDNESADVFVFERTTGMMSLASRGVNGRSANGSSGSPAISADGRFVAFHSDASDLICSSRCAAAAEDINLLADVFLLDRATGTVTRLSADAAGSWIEESIAPVMDDEGRTVVFASRHPIDRYDVANDFDLFVRLSPPLVHVRR